MSDELKKRFLFTLALLAAVRALNYIPLPGINPASLAEIVSSASSGPNFGASVFSRETIGALGLFPYFGASGLIILILYFPRFRHGVNDHDVAIEFYTFSLGGMIVLLQSYGIAAFLENLGPLPSGELVVPDPGWGFRFTTMLSHTAGFFLLIWLAHLISRKGIGNGVCLITLTTLLHTTLFALVDIWTKSRMSQLTEDAMMQIVFIIIPLMLLSFLAVLVLLGAQWKLPLKRSKLVDGIQFPYLPTNQWRGSYWPLRFSKFAFYTDHSRSNRALELSGKVASPKYQ